MQVVIQTPVSRLMTPVSYLLNSRTAIVNHEDIGVEAIGWIADRQLIHRLFDGNGRRLA